MTGILSGPRPDITPVQIVSGIPILAELGHAFGVFTLSQPQQDSLSKAATWGLGLLVVDFGHRAVRNLKDGKIQAAAIAKDSTPPIGPTDDDEIAEPDEEFPPELDFDDEPDGPAVEQPPEG